MDLDQQQRIRQRVAEFQAKHRIGLVVMMFTDIVGSTKLKADLGDLRGTRVIQWHHGLVREQLLRFSEAEEINVAGDGFFNVFSRASDAVKFGLLLHSALRAGSPDSETRVAIRIGIHAGEVLIVDGDEAREMFGMQVDAASRVMSLAVGGQILMTRFVFENARRLLTGSELGLLNSLSWVEHGYYTLKGVSEPIDIFEVGELGVAPLVRPHDTDKSWRSDKLPLDLSASRLGEENKPQPSEKSGVAELRARFFGCSINLAIAFGVILVGIAAATVRFTQTKHEAIASHGRLAIPLPPTPSAVPNSTFDLKSPRLTVSVGIPSAMPVQNGRGKRLTQEESDDAFHLFLNIKEELVQRCIHKPTAVGVVSGALDGLRRKLDPNLSTYFPDPLDHDLQGAFRQYQETLRNLLASPAMSNYSLKQLVVDSVNAYLPTLDEYGEYITPEEAAAEQAPKQSEYVGIGLTLKKRSGAIEIFPFPGGPAASAGGYPGGHLVSVDGKSVDNLSVHEVARSFKGPEGSEIHLGIFDPLASREEVLTVKRGKIVTPSITVEKGSKGVWVRLRALDSKAVADLRVFLGALHGNESLSLDLRGCSRGNLSAAEAIAEMFLPAGERIGEIQTREGAEEFVSHNNSPFRANPLVIMQDRGTFGAAEFLLVALSFSPKLKVESRGEKTFGMGLSMQTVEFIGGGGQLTFAAGRLYGPHGEFWDGEGVSPMIIEPTRPL